METERHEQTRVIGPNGEQTIREKRIYDGSGVHGQHPVTTYQEKVGLLRLSQIVWFMLGIIEVLLILRLVLLVVGANPLAQFTVLIYNLSSPLTAPFRGILGVSSVGPAVIEWSTLIAILVYAIIAYGILKIIEFFNPVTPRQVDEQLNKKL